MIKAKNTKDIDAPFIIDGTMADPRWLDLTIDRNDRSPAGYCFLGECETANNQPTGIARFGTVRSFLSQWADGVSELDALKHLPRTRVPTLVVTHSADNGVPKSHGQMMFDAVAHAHKQHYVIKGAQHYFLTADGKLQKPHLFEAVTVIGQFVDSHCSKISLSSLQSQFGTSQFPPTHTTKSKSTFARGINHVALVVNDMADTGLLRCYLL